MKVNAAFARFLQIYHPAGIMKADNPAGQKHVESLILKDLAALEKTDELCRKLNIAPVPVNYSGG